jgi:hypothetical protein
LTPDKTEKDEKMKFEVYVDDVRNFHPYTVRMMLAAALEKDTFINERNPKVVVSEEDDPKPTLHNNKDLMMTNIVVLGISLAVRHGKSIQEAAHTVSQLAFLLNTSIAFEFSGTWLTVPAGMSETDIVELYDMTRNTA